MNEWWEGLILAVLGLGIIWSARGAAEVKADMDTWMRSRVPRRRWWYYGLWWKPNARLGAWIGRGIGLVVLAVGVALMISGDLFGLL